MQVMRIVARAVLVVVAAGLVGCANDGNTTSASSSAAKPESPRGESSESHKPNVAQLTASMVVDQSSFPTIEGAQWTPAALDPFPGYIAGRTTISPQECMPLLATPELAHQWAAAVLNAGSYERTSSILTFDAAIGLSTEYPDFSTLVGRCATVTRNDTNLTFERYPIPGLPSWSTSVLQTIPSEGGAQTVTIFGVYRGVLIVVHVSRGAHVTAEDTAAVAHIFNDQVAKIEAE